VRDQTIETQQAFWNDWNAFSREKELGDVSIEQAEVIVTWMKSFKRPGLKIIDVGCGAGWLCEQLACFGQVTGTDLSDEVLARAAQRIPQAKFVAGDFMALDFGGETFDVVTCLEVLPHVADQPAFMAKLAGLLKPGGCLMLATQNKPALLRNDVPAPKQGQLRRWVDRHELAQLLGSRFTVEQMFSITPQFNRGWLRIVNSYKLKRVAEVVKLGPVVRLVKRYQERAWLGWTIMALARRK
jgi:2-polyprenyl-3-methyl-5-hydroxy-6-metoxy-1,4-benzoquinol methylase